MTRSGPLPGDALIQMPFLARIQQCTAAAVGATRHRYSAVTARFSCCWRMAKATECPHAPPLRDAHNHSRRRPPLAIPPPALPAASLPVTSLRAGCTSRSAPSVRSVTSSRPPKNSTPAATPRRRLARRWKRRGSSCATTSRRDFTLGCAARSSRRGRNCAVEALVKKNAEPTNNRVISGVQYRGPRALPCGGSGASGGARRSTVTPAGNMWSRCGGVW